MVTNMIPSQQKINKVASIRMTYRSQMGEALQWMKGYVWLNDLNTINSYLSSVGINFDEEIRALLILCSLPKSWNGLIMDVM